MSTNEPIKAYCGACRRHTKHTERASYHEPWEEEVPLSGGTISGFHGYSILQCNGCGNVHFENTEWESEDPTDARITVYPTVPVLDENHRPISIDALPPKVAALYVETIAAMRAATPILAAIGIRGIVEAVCKDKGCEGANLQKRIEKLKDIGVVASAHIKFLHQHRLIGNEAAHEMLAPNHEEMVGSLMITEALLLTVYTLPKVGEDIDASRRGRSLQSALTPAPPPGGPPPATSGDGEPTVG